MSSRSSDAGDDAPPVPPIVATNERATPKPSAAATAAGPSEQPATLPEALRVLDMQDKIIEALQRDNQGFVSEKRQLVSRAKELEDALANLEAKHSLMLSAQNTQERERVSAPDTEGATAKLKARINELEFQLEGAVEARSAAETELSRHKNCGTALQLAEAEIQNLNVALRRMEKDQQKNVEEMAKRIHSFAEEGNYNAETEARLQQQEETIRRLRTQISDVVTGEKQKRDGGTQQSKEVHALNRRIVELEDQLRQKGSESIADLIRSCQPSAQDSKLFKRQEAHIEQLKEALAAKDKFTEAAVERLRLESAQVRRLYEEKLLDAETKASQYHRSERDQQNKIRELEKETHSLRRDLANVSTQMGTMRAVDTTRRDDPGLKALGEENAALREQIRSLEASLANSSSHARAEQSPVVEALQALVRSLTEEVSTYKKLSEESQRLTQDANDRAERRVLQWKQEMLTQMQSAREEYNREIDRLQRNHQNELARALERHAGESSLNDEMTRQWRAVLREQGQEGFLQTVLDRLQFLEGHYRQKEKEFTYELAQAKRSFDLERSMEAQRYELNLERKNQQIADFRVQLDQLLSNVALLSAQSS